MHEDGLLNPFMLYLTLIMPLIDTSFAPHLLPEGCAKPALERGYSLLIPGSGPCGLQSLMRRNPISKASHRSLLLSIYVHLLQTYIYAWRQLLLRSAIEKKVLTQDYDRKSIFPANKRQATWISPSSQNSGLLCTVLASLSYSIDGTRSLLLCLCHNGMHSAPASVPSDDALS